MTNKQWRLRNDVVGRVMLTETLRLLLDEHRVNPWQRLYLFSWRHGPDNKFTLYDMDLPRRKAITEDTRKGYEEADWWNNSVVVNVPMDYLPVYTTVSRKTGEIVRMGYKDVLTTLLNTGCVVPSRCLSDWLLDDSRKFSQPWTRLFYKEN